MEQELILTRKEAAKLARVNVQKLDSFISAGVLPVIRLGPRAIRIHRGSLEDFLRSKEVVAVRGEALQ